MEQPRQELKIGAPVETTDGPFGHVQQVILSPLQRRVVGLVVRTGPFPPQARVVPAGLILEATEEKVALRVSHAEILKQPVFDPSQFLPAAGKELGYQAGEALASVHGGAGGSADLALSSAHQRGETKVADQGPLEGQTVILRSGQPVWATDGRAGRVDLLLLDDAGLVRHFVIRKGGFLGRDVIVPVDWINKIDGRGVWLAMERAALDRLPPYRPDGAIASDVSQALWRDSVLRVIDFEAIDVTVRDGIVTLAGFARTAANKRRAELAARTVPGVLGVENRIVSDEEVVKAVAQALAHDERTRRERIFVSAHHGVVTLNGRVNNAQARACVEEVVACVPQVRGIINYIEAPGVVVNRDEPRILQPRIGQDVHADDMLLGQVEKVIINPRNRRVTAFVARGGFPDPEQARPGMLSVEIPRKERQVVIPVEVVDFVTHGSVLLKINGIAAARYPDFKPEEFSPPDPAWQPPYPYTHADVMLAPDRNVATDASAIYIQSLAGRQP